MDITGPHGSANAVHAQQQRIRAEFHAGDPGAEWRAGSADGPYERLLTEILARTGWKGQPTTVVEAMPHLEPIGSFVMLRTVLDRLQIELVPVPRAVSALAPAEFPCVLLDAEGRACLIARDEEGDCWRYDPIGDTWDVVAPACLKGAVLVVARSRVGDGAPDSATGGFTQALVARLKGSLVRIAALSAGISALGLLLSLYVVMVYDTVIATRSTDTLVVLALGALAVLAAEHRLRAWRARMIAYVAARFDAVVSVRTLSVVLDLPLSSIERAPLSTQLARFRQFEIGRELFAGNVASALFDLPFTLMFLAALFVIGGSLAFVPIAIAAVMVLVCATLAGAARGLTHRLAATRQQSDSLLFELIDKLRTIRRCAAERTWLARYSESLADHQSARFEAAQSAIVGQVVSSALVALAGVLTLALGALSVMDATLSVGGLVAAMMIVWRVLAPVQIVSLNITRLRQTLQTVTQINELAALRPERAGDRPHGEFRSLGGEIGAAGIYLTLGAQTNPQLRGISMEIGAGQIVAITGPSGSGKSTLLKVFLGLYQNYMGTLRIAGLDARQLDPAEIRHMVGYVPQRPSFFYGSLAANMRFARADATDEDILAALAAVGLTLPHTDLPDGLETRMSGTTTRALSPGLLCRLAIARALVKKPSIILLDDPGNGLDRAGDDALARLVERLRGSVTVLWVTARPSHMRIADRVVELRAGQIVADGKPAAIVPRILAQIAESAA